MASRFVSGTEIQRNVKRLKSPRSSAIAAVAFWGKDGVKKAGLEARRGRDTRVICDLFSGACNPNEIRVMIDAGVHVKTIDGMHAKVWSNGAATLVGSANASANGLGDEGNNLSGNIEAAVLIQDAAFAKDVWDWFEGLWERATPVGEDEIKEAQSPWERRRSSLDRRSANAGVTSRSPNQRATAVSALNADYRTAFEKVPIGSLFSKKEVGKRLREYTSSKVTDSGCQPSDRCYNITNSGLAFNWSFRIFKYIKRSCYEYLGEEYDYNGDVTWTPKGKGNNQEICGKWTGGVLEKYDNWPSSNPKHDSI